MNAIRVLAAALLAMLIVACAREISVTAVFSEPSELDAGVPVYLGESEVGEIASLTRTGNHTEAELSLDAESVDALRSGSAALLATRNGTTVIELYNYRPGTEPLRSGDELVGLSNPIEYAAWQAGEVMASGRQSLDEMTKSFSDYFDSEAWRQQRDRMNRQLAELEEDMGRAYDETSEAYDEFMRNLESESESARERAQEAYSELAQRIREQIAELRDQGNERIIVPLQRFLEDLTRALEKKPEQREV